MNSDQLQSLLRDLLKVGGPVSALLVNSGVTPGAVNTWLTLGLAILPPIVGALWSYFAHTDHATIAAAANVPGVEAIAISALAQDGAAKAAADPALPTVQTVP